MLIRSEMLIARKNKQSIQAVQDIWLPVSWGPLLSDIQLINHIIWQSE